MKTIRTHIQYWIDYKGTGDEKKKGHGSRQIYEYSNSR